MEALRKQGLLDDVAFARFWRQSRERHRPKGASVLRWELTRMGVSREVVDEALEGLDEEEGAYLAASRMVRRLDQADYGTFRKKLAAYLRRRGFSHEAVGRTIQRLWQELSDSAYGHIEGDAHEKEPKDGAQRTREGRPRATGKDSNEHTPSSYKG